MVLATSRSAIVVTWPAMSTSSISISARFVLARLTAKSAMTEMSGARISTTSETIRKRIVLGRFDRKLRKRPMSGISASKLVLAPSTAHASSAKRNHRKDQSIFYAQLSRLGSSPDMHFGAAKVREVTPPSIFAARRWHPCPMMGFARLIATPISEH
ncbi:MAG: hypothetical protein U1E81_01895 [Xanthobacteraceae bacterium]